MRSTLHCKWFIVSSTKQLLNCRHLDASQSKKTWRTQKQLKPSMPIFRNQFRNISAIFRHEKYVGMQPRLEKIRFSSIVELNKFENAFLVRWSESDNSFESEVFFSENFPYRLFPFANALEAWILRENMYAVSCLAWSVMWPWRATTVAPRAAAAAAACGSAGKRQSTFLETGVNWILISQSRLASRWLPVDASDSDHIHIGFRKWLLAVPTPTPALVSTSTTIFTDSSVSWLQQCAIIDPVVLPVGYISRTLHWW